MGQLKVLVISGILSIISLVVLVIALTDIYPIPPQIAFLHRERVCPSIQQKAVSHFQAIFHRYWLGWVGKTSRSWNRQLLSLAWKPRSSQMVSSLRPEYLVVPKTWARLLFGVFWAVNEYPAHRRSYCVLNPFADQQNSFSPTLYFFGNAGRLILFKSQDAVA